MMKLSDRLQMIADFVKPGEILADIGTDHGLLPISLWEQGKVPHVILSDIKKGPLEKARENIASYAPGNVFDIRLGAGLSTLKQGEADTVVIAGMGGLLITDILDADATHTATFQRFILQPRNAQDKLRAWLVNHGFLFQCERLVRESRYIWEIFAVKNCSFLDDAERAEQERQRLLFEAEDREHGLAYEVNPLLFQGEEPLLWAYLEKKKQVEERIRWALLEAGKSEDEKLLLTEKRIEGFNKLLERVSRPD